MRDEEMTIELTHEQAWKLRLGMHDGHNIECSDEELWDLFETTEHDYILGLNDAGKAALARYNAKHRIVEARVLSHILGFAEYELQRRGAVPYDHPSQLEIYEGLRDAVAKAKEALK